MGLRGFVFAVIPLHNGESLTTTGTPLGNLFVIMTLIGGVPEGDGYGNTFALLEGDGRRGTGLVGGRGVPQTHREFQSVSDPVTPMQRPPALSNPVPPLKFLLETKRLDWQHDRCIPSDELPPME